MSARVLIVEDQRDLAELLAHNLRLEGLEVRTVLDGREAVGVAETWAPDLMILDLMLPGMDLNKALNAQVSDTIP